jgi:hypothetical protein
MTMVREVLTWARCFSDGVPTAEAGTGSPDPLSDRSVRSLHKSGSIQEAARSAIMAAVRVAPEERLRLREHPHQEEREQEQRANEQTWPP